MFASFQFYFLISFSFNLPKLTVFSPYSNNWVIFKAYSQKSQIVLRYLIANIYSWISNYVLQIDDLWHYVKYIFCLIKADYDWHGIGVNQYIHVYKYDQKPLNSIFIAILDPLIC